MERIVIALGGNAIDSGNSGINEQIEKAVKAFSELADIISNNEVAITYGNGPQVGNIYEKGYDLDLSVAMSNGMLSYIISMAYDRAKYISGISKDIITMVTRTVVNPDIYTMKPVGRFYDKKIDDSYYYEINRGYRKRVKSPEPVDILEKSAISNLMANGFLPVAVGGGGIPVVQTLQYYSGFPGVIDKDLASALLGNLIDADTLMIITGVKNIYLDYSKKDGIIKSIDYDKMLDYYNTINFEEGTIKPKILAALKFLERGGRKVYITSIENIKNLNDGTVIYK
ncbi:amino acid kinase family protein [Picrophilus oshimae]|uniref:Carbamate kinase n=1 Tax=Picrophilus torridus (strain ATCC 700027 / DSM 9790 / JCM 10055 / NBRC 100828 / KAW 2/3) TaxID=1122961 RepID=Q6L1H7_PICTO|nr:carbamate kinase [Picrophilus oshimae]AAT43175.1 carbamate kinase [Picrophilus oshimae DSM 9789]SMD30521.1 carbamate kinase [Picrophilus oshimae DSM 9789]